MIRIKCPFCGERDHSEFSYGGDGSIVYPSLDASPREWIDSVFFRENIKGPQIETWYHSGGCRMWLKVKRDTLTHEIFSVEPCHRDLMKVVKEK
tara:strand:+ start:281 stop:562 length:282 start_codon:yes stop_codon:yes gene_type:complete